ncbi:MAG: TraR/DksA C4-type zinc finger protein [Myxococcales bacterium]|jgi:RNA polymerase-binding transcription factor DksA|nr:TraR/DksA C4-type zinc finger protein [Myxococcales bacterium]
MMDSTLSDHFREKLQRRRHALVAGRRSMARADQTLRESRDAEFEEQMQADELITTIETLDSERDAEIAEIDAALERLDAGIYGRCAIDGEEIDPARLDALPYTRLCAAHAAAQAFDEGWHPPAPL